MRRRGGGRRRVAGAALALAVVLGTAGCAAAAGPPGPPPRSVPATTAPAATTAPGAPEAPRATVPARSARPVEVVLPSIGVAAPLIGLGLTADRRLEVPEDYGVAGWYTGGPRPGQPGPAVIAGHVDSRSGPAVFYKLRELERGDRIEVVRGGRTLAFTVTATAWYPKNDFPTDRVYAPTPDRQLRLITCGGVFDHTLRSYKDNLVVYAVAG
jgi:LPXTG-site transpeptidase (sortase) family protein